MRLANATARNDYCEPERQLTVGFKFTLILNRKITKKETSVLRDSGCAQAEFSTDALPTDASGTVARLDFDDTESTTLAEAIEAGLEAVKKVPDLSVPGLHVPAQPATLGSAELEVELADELDGVEAGAGLVEAVAGE